MIIELITSTVRLDEGMVQVIELPDNMSKELTAKIEAWIDEENGA